MAAWKTACDSWLARTICCLGAGHRLRRRGARWAAAVHHAEGELRHARHHDAAGRVALHVDTQRARPARVALCLALPRLGHPKERGAQPERGQAVQVALVSAQAGEVGERHLGCRPGGRQAERAVLRRRVRQLERSRAHLRLGREARQCGARPSRRAASATVVLRRRREHAGARGSPPRGAAGPPLRARPQPPGAARQAAAPATPHPPRATASMRSARSSTSSAPSSAASDVQPRRAHAPEREPLQHA
jgi:hypothetical protein